MIELTPEQQRFIEAEVAAGDFSSPSAVVQAAVELYRQARSRDPNHDIDDAVRDVTEALADIEAGRVRPFAEVDSEIRAKHGFRARG